MTFEILNKDEMQNYITQVWQEELDTDRDPANGTYYETNPDGSTGGLYGAVTDSADSQPVFDRGHMVYTPKLTDQIGATVDNHNGLNPVGTATFAYTNTQGATTSHSTTTAITLSETESVEVDFEVASSTTTFSLSASFSYTEGTSSTTITTETSSFQDQIHVPSGKVYESHIMYTTETLVVPYTLSAYAQGNSETWFSSRVNGQYNHVMDIGDVFVQINENGIAGSESPLYQYAGNGTGAVVLSGEATLKNTGAYIVKTYDVTGNYYPSSPGPTLIGVHETMDDNGGIFKGTRFDDLVDGGAGNDLIRLGAGDDIAHGGGGDDIVRSFSGKNVLDGGEGDDELRVVSTKAYNELYGGSGDDWLSTSAPMAVLDGGTGNDHFSVGARGGGAMIYDEGGDNHLSIAHEGVLLLFERVGDDLFIHLDGDTSYDYTSDIYWNGFFKGDGNSINRLSFAAVEARAERVYPDGVLDGEHISAGDAASADHQLLG